MASSEAMNLTNPDVGRIKKWDSQHNYRPARSHKQKSHNDPRWGFATGSRIPKIFADNHGLRDRSHFLLQKPVCLLIMIETDNGETDTQPPVALPSTCPLPAASRFQQMPELIRAAYVSPRSHWCYFKAHSARGRRIVVYKRKYVESRYICGFSINYCRLQRSSLFLGHL